MNKAINKKVVITGGPGTGKTSVIEELTNRGCKCFDEGSRDIILNLSLKGKTFKSDPLTFSDSLYTLRNKHYSDSQKKEYNRKTVFLTEVFMIFLHTLGILTKTISIGRI